MNREDFDLLGNTCANNKWGDHEFENNFWWIQQHQEEFWNLIELLQKHKVKNILEIGSSHGGTLTFFKELMKDDGVLVAIENNKDIAFSLPKSWSYIPENIYLLNNNSHHKKTWQSIKKILGNKLFDFIFIDGDHSYEGCIKDFELSFPFLKNGGIVAFHDVAIDKRVKNVFDSLIFPKEILPVYFMGIGVVYKC